MDFIDIARVAMERADDAYAAAEERGAGYAVLDTLAQEAADAESRYWRAVDALGR